MQTQHWTAAVVYVSWLIAPTQAALAQTGASPIGSEYVPGDATATMVLSVAETMASPVAEYYPTEIADAWCKQNVGFLASSVDKLKVVVGAPGPAGPMMAVVGTLKEDLDSSSMNPEYVDTEQPEDVDGHRCYQIAGAPDVVLHIKDARTLVLATPNYLDTVLRAAEPSDTRGPLARMASSVAHTGNMTTLIAVEPMRPMVSGLLQAQADKIPPPLAEFTKVPDLLEAVLIRVNLEDATSGLNLVMLAVDDASAKELSGLIQRGLEMGRQIGLSQVTSQLQGEDAVTEASRQYAQRMADMLVASFTPTRKGRRLSLSGSPSQGVAAQGVLISLLLPAVQAARKAARRTSSANNMRQMGLAMHFYHEQRRELPTNIKAADGSPLLSWRVAILPFVEQAALYEQFHLDEPWDSPHNLKLLEQMPDIYSHPEYRTDPGTTVYQRPVGDEFLMRPSAPVRFRDILDGTSNTILAVETIPEAAVEWTKPADLVIDEENSMKSVADGKRNGFNALIADGAVVFMAEPVDPQAFLGMLTRAGEEDVRP